MDCKELSITRKIERTIQEHSLAGKGHTVVVAVSGGVDSVVLLDYLASRKDLELCLVIAHLNHSLRGVESDGDEKFVRSLAEQYGLRCEIRREDVGSIARGKGLSLEEAGREARYSYFKYVAQTVGADSVAIAHHLDDQAETVLLRLIRGSGPTGLRGMFHRSLDGLYVRPLLDVTRSEIEDYAASRKLLFRTDSSNSDTSFLRNRIRLELLPLLSGYNPAIAFRLAETASIMAADEALLSGVVLTRWHEVGEKCEHGIILNVESVRIDLTGLRYRLYRLSIEMLNGNLRRISYRHLQGVDRLLMDGPPNGTLNLPDGLLVIRSYGKMVFTQKTGDVEDTDFEITIECEGDHNLPSGLKISVNSLEDETSSAERDRMEMFVNLSEFPLPWIIRSFKPGDRIVPRGMNGHKKVKDIFIDGKVPRAKRMNIPLFFSGGSLFWIPGLTRSGKVCQHGPDLRRVRVELLEIIQDAAMLA